MRREIRTHLAHALRRSLALATIVIAVGAGSIGPSALGLLGVSSLAITFASPAEARCLIKSVMRQDIADSDCEEAQRTGCVKSKLSPQGYQNCLNAQTAVKRTGQECYVDGRVRRDLNPSDCAEAKGTGCVRSLLTPAQYTACLNAQPAGRR